MPNSDETLKKLLDKLNVVGDLSNQAGVVISRILDRKAFEKSDKNVIEDILNNLVIDAKSVKDDYSKWLEDNSDSSSFHLLNGSIPRNEKSENSAAGSFQQEDSQSATDEAQQSEDVEKQQFKTPMLKIVDFSKLVDPKNLELMDKNHKQKVSNDSSIIILSSSDDEAETLPKVVQKNQPTKTKKSVNKLSSNKNIKNNQKSRVISSKAKTSTFNSGEKRLLSIYKNDPRLRCEAYVKVLRVPCEEMENYYSLKGKTGAVDSPILDERTGELLQNKPEHDKKKKEVQNKPRRKNQKKTYEESSSSEDIPLKNVVERKERNKRGKESSEDDQGTDKGTQGTKDTSLSTEKENNSNKKDGKKEDQRKEKSKKVIDDDHSSSNEAIEKSEVENSKSKRLRNRISLKYTEQKSESSSSDEEMLTYGKRIGRTKKKDKESNENLSESRKTTEKKDENSSNEDNDCAAKTPDPVRNKTNETEEVSQKKASEIDENEKNDSEEQVSATPDKSNDDKPVDSEENSDKAVDETEKTAPSEDTESEPMRIHEDENIEKEGAKDTSPDKGTGEKSNSNKIVSDDDMFDEDTTTQKDKEVSKDKSRKSDPELYILSEADDKGGDSSSDSDIVKQKKKAIKTINSKDIIEIDSDESDDFASLGKTNTRKRKLKNIGSDSEEEKKEDSDSDNKKSSDSEKSKKKNDKGGTAKRRRIQELDNSDSDKDELDTRKKIKKVISTKSLSDQTKRAGAEERERRQRILEKQKKYNQIYENLETASSKVDKLVLDVDEKTEKPILQVNKTLVSKLKPHQASGIQFMWDACFESIERIENSEGSGCILAHCMGLGKTLQVIALTHTLLEASEKTKVRKVLIVTPLSTVLNWKAEFKNWLSDEEDYEVFELVTCKPQNAERAMYVRQWHDNGGVMIMSYSMFRNLSNEKIRKVSKKIRATFHEGLVDPGPDLVVCDEGHLLKNEKTSLSVAMNKIKTKRRIVLTGTPLQNNLKEYYCMVHFVKPSLLGTYKEYLNRFVNPITNGQYTDSTDYDINVMRRRSHVLHKLLEGIVQRRDYSVLSPYLPPKFEYVLFLTLTETQKKLYNHYLTHFARKSKDDSTNRASYLFQDFQAFSRICIHPRVLLDKSVEDQMKYQSGDEESVGSLKDFIADSSESSTSSSDSSGSESDNSTNSNKKKKKKVSKRVTRAQKATQQSDSEPEEEIEPAKEWWQEYCDGDELENMAHSTKILILFEILKECEQIGDKVLVFSQSLYALNVIEYFLAKVDEATQNGETKEKTCGYSGSWTPGLDYFRLDGSTNCSLRSNWCDSFNKESNSRARLFLLSTRAGGLGINLVAANRVIIFDVSWNPSSDLQSIYRVYRFGQLKPSYIYRFVIYGTMEMKIYERQVTKQAISKRVIDEQQIDRHYNQNDLTELYQFEQPTIDERPIPLVPKDVLLGELLQNQETRIFKYHEHQSLLENKEDETLNEEERKAAWDEFENEKVERTKQTLIGKFSISTVQLALKSIIQKDNPSWNNNQILSIIPQLIQNLNYQLGQGDNSLYNRIAAEVKFLQDEYARKMQMQFLHHRMQMEAQRQQFGGMYQGMRVPNPFFNQMHLWNTPGSSGINPNEVLELN